MKIRIATILTLSYIMGFGTRGEEPPAKKSTGPETNPAKMLVLDLGNGVSLKLTKIPAGKFKMGVPKETTNRDKQDEDEREMTINKDFWMGVTEITQAQYEIVMGENPSKSGKDPQFPVDSVSFKQAVEFCSKLSDKTGKSVRLPTEAEWEYAARAGGKGLGNAKIIDVAWCKENSDSKPHAVGTRTSNAWGLYDMLGNANEWAKSEKWVGYRGGCWRTPGAKCLPTHREGHGHLHHDPYGGFRVVIELK